ncbi:MAG: CHAT domain-containing tetratricopeptide repeat protein [Acidobacteriota bacterium]
MSSALADKLMSAEDVEAFLRQQGGRIEWTLMAELKAEVDRLVGCDLNAAGRLVERMEQLAALTSEPVSEAFAKASRGRMLGYSGHHAQANELYEDAVSAMRAARLSREAAFLQIQMLTDLILLARYDDALRLSRSVRRALRGGDKVQLAQFETNVGHIHYRRDRYKKALEHYDRAREILSKVGDESMRATVDFGRSNIFTDTDRPDEAMTLLDSAAQAWDQTGQSLHAGIARFHKAYIQFLKGNYNDALTAYYQTRDQLAQLGSLPLVASCNLEIAEILLALNAFDDAVESAAAAHASFSELGMIYDSARAALIGAIAAMGAHNFEQAQNGLTEARAVFEQTGNATFTALVDSYLAELALRSKDGATALQRGAAALRVFARQKLPVKSAYSRLIVARAAYETGDLPRSARMARAALRAVEGSFASSLVYRCHHLIGHIERRRGRRGRALENFRRAAEVIEQMRGGIISDEFKATFLRDKMEVYEDAISACLDEGSEVLIEEAFRLVESSKSRALADLLARYLRDSIQSTQRSPEAETRARLLKLIEDLNWYNSRAGLEDDKGNQRNATLADRYRREVRRCEKQIAQLFRRLEAESSAFAEIHQMQAASASDLKSALGADETAIEYFITGDEISAFVATGERVRLARRIASRHAVEAALAAFRFQIEKFNFGSRYVDSYLGQLKRATDDYLARLSEMVFAPLRELIETESVVIIPHGALHYVPFHALRDGGDYLVERFEISYAPSAAVLKLCRARRGKSQSGGGRMIALGVDHRDTPHIADEIREIGSLFPDSITLIGEDATRENLFRFAPEARFLHLASHGYFRRDNPMFSFLKLADSPLNFYSLLDLRLRAEMVTLSACHTGVNMVFPGDELHGLMRGFLYAGAPSLVASLWAVSDTSTAELMREMYRLISQGESKRSALRKAQLKIKDDYGHPYYWAPFALMGNPI